MGHSKYLPSALFSVSRLSKASAGIGFMADESIGDDPILDLNQCVRSLDVAGRFWIDQPIDRLVYGEGSET